MHEDDSSLIEFNKDTGMHTILAITIQVWLHNIINLTHFNLNISKKKKTFLVPLSLHITPHFSKSPLLCFVVSIQMCQKENKEAYSQIYPKFPPQ